MQKYSKILTGFSFIDHKWNGVYSGGNYFVFGLKKSGKTILALNIIEYLINHNHKVLLLTSERRKSLEIQADSVYFDISEATDSGILKIEKIDDTLNDFENLKLVIKENNPSILFIDEVINKNLGVIAERYNEFLEFIEELNITSFFIGSAPTDNRSKNIIKLIARNSTAIIQLQKTSPKRNYSGTIILKPNIGHFEGEFETTYKVEPIKGFITFSNNEKSLSKIFAYKDNSVLIDKKKEFEYSNLYGIDEFKFLLESKVALSSRTGERINIISYEFLNNTISPIELCNVFKRKLSKGDKICCTEKMIYILPEHNQSSFIQKLSNQLDEEAVKLVNDPINYDKLLEKKVTLLKPNFEIN